MTKRNLPYLMVVAALSAVLAFATIGCGGDDEETPAGACQTSSDCADGQACYNNVCVGICTSDADCAGTLTCDPVFKVCLPGDITDGDVDIDDTCTVGQNQCIGTTVYTCVSGAWTAGQNCADTGMTCQNGVCIPATTDGDTDEVVDGDTTDDVDTVDDVDTTDNATCTEGEKKCIGDMAYACSNGNWGFLEDCAAAGKTCSAGVCTGGTTTTELCPTGQTCAAITDSGVMGCVEGDALPANSQTGCGQDSPCTQNGGNASCFCQDANCTETVCISNCGTCPSGQTCAAITDSGVKGCVEGDALPANSQTGCGENSPCTQNGGNASCFCQDANCTETVCISNCSADNGGTVVDPPTGEGCPTGQTCASITDSGVLGCVEGDALPANSQTGCGQDSPCTQNSGNASCFCQDANCTETVCISNCGSCPSGQTCAAITDSGVKGCVEGDALPANSQTGCGQDSPCTQNSGNASCFCQDANCTETVCISNCGA